MTTLEPGQLCAACEGSPKPPNDPCAVCGRHSFMTAPIDERGYINFRPSKAALSPAAGDAEPRVAFPNMKGQGDLVLVPSGLLSGSPSNWKMRCVECGKEHTAQPVTSHSYVAGGPWDPSTAPAAGDAGADVVELLRPFLIDDCGCSPRCRCDEEGALRIWKENARDAIRTALAAIAAMPASPPAAEVEEMAGRCEEAADRVAKRCMRHPAPALISIPRKPTDVDAVLDAAAALLRRLAGERDALNERLENNRVFDGEGNRIDVEPGSIPDGIECRNETIKLQDERIERLTARAAAAETRVKELEKALREIAEQDLVELTLDPDWPRRVARAALGGTHEP